MVPKPNGLHSHGDGSGKLIKVTIEARQMQTSTDNFADTEDPDTSFDNSNTAVDTSDDNVTPPAAASSTSPSPSSLAATNPVSAPATASSTPPASVVGSGSGNSGNGVPQSPSQLAALHASNPTPNTAPVVAAGTSGNGSGGTATVSGVPAKSSMFSPMPIAIGCSVLIAVLVAAVLAVVYVRRRRSQTTATAQRAASTRKHRPGLAIRVPSSQIGLTSLTKPGTAATTTTTTTDYEGIGYPMGATVATPGLAKMGFENIPMTPGGRRASDAGLPPDNITEQERKRSFDFQRIDPNAVMGGRHGSVVVANLGRSKMAMAQAVTSRAGYPARLSDSGSSNANEEDEGGGSRRESVNFLPVPGGLGAEKRESWLTDDSRDSWSGTNIATMLAKYQQSRI
jgi:hypothetical protein